MSVATVNGVMSRVALRAEYKVVLLMRLFDVVSGTMSRRTENCEFLLLSVRYIDLVK